MGFKLDLYRRSKDDPRPWRGILGYSVDGRNEYVTNGEALFDGKKIRNLSELNIEDWITLAAEYHRRASLDYDDTLYYAFSGNPKIRFSEVPDLLQGNLQASGEILTLFKDLIQQIVAEIFDERGESCESQRTQRGRS